MTAFMLAMQAAGFITSIFDAHSKEKMIKLGRKLEQEQFTTNLQAIRLQSAEASLNEMKELRKSIGSQIAIQAARGNRGGSSYAGISESSYNFDSDERLRRMNLLAKESELRAGNVLSGLHTLQSESELGQSLTKGLFNTLQTNSLFDNAKINSFVKSKFSWGTA